MKKILLPASLIFITALHGFAQVVGPNAYVKGTYMEFAVGGLGGFEGVDITASPVPAGMHWRSGNQIFGIMGNPQKNSWSGSAFDGDFFTPGSPENGWGFEIGTSGTTASGTAGSNNCAFLQEINGTITSYNYSGGYYTVNWQGTSASGALTFQISYSLQDTSLFYTTSVSVTNNTAATIPDFYYYRNIDPDNNQPLSGSFTTEQKIISQPTATSGHAMVRAIMYTPWTSYIALIGNGPGWKANYGGFSNRDGSDLWHSIGFTGTVGSVNTADEAISLSYRIQNFLPGSTQSFTYKTVIDTNSLAAALNELPFIDFIGEDNNSSLIPDTTAACASDSVALTITGASVSDYTWNWSPSTGLSASSGITVLAAPPVQTTYTVIGTPIAMGGTPDTMLIVVNPIATYSGPTASLSFLGQYCGNTPAFTLSSGTPAGGTYTGPGVIGGNFDPAASGPGDFVITYIVNDSSGCTSTDTASIHVFATNVSIPATYGNICHNDPPLVLTGASVPGGVFSGGPYIVNDSIFDPSIAGPGTYYIYYTATDTNGCSATDTSNINVYLCSTGAGVGTYGKYDQISMYPNPFFESTMIYTGKDLILDNAEIVLYDLAGKELKRIKVTGHEVKICRDDLAYGTYFLSLFNHNERIASAKLVIN